MTNTTRMPRLARATGLAVAVIMSSLMAGGCADFMEVTNPGAIEVPALENIAYLQLMHDGAVGDFQPAVAWTALFSGMFVDELRVHHTYFENLEIDQRRVTENNGTAALAVWNGLHRARFMADSMAGRYRQLIGDTVGYDARYARLLAYAGYAYNLLGENVCETRINGQGNTLAPAELFTTAIGRFDAAIAAAGEARTAAARITVVATRDRMIALADSLANMARVGAARAALNAGDKPKAISYAQAVAPAYGSPAAPGFRYDLFFKQGNSSTETRRYGSPYWEFISAGGSWVSVSGTPFEQLNDPRVPHGAAGAISVSSGGNFFVPNSPASFSTYSGTVTGGLFTRDSRLRLASALEARYIIAEAQGLTANNVDFLNQQRAIGGQLPLTNPDAATYLAALRDQRSREFFIDGHRLGDLRRYERMYTLNLWPTGAMYGTTTTYGDQKCWPTPTAEIYW
jgi:hypothetical protein